LSIDDLNDNHKDAEAVEMLVRLCEIMNN